MANLVECKECGHKVSKSAKACPNCGHRKKGFLDGCGTLIVVVLVLIAAIWFFTSVFFVV